MSETAGGDFFDSHCRLPEWSHWHCFTWIIL